MARITPAIAERLGCYVYVFRRHKDLDPKQPVIYIGKGSGSRSETHLDGSHNEGLDREIQRVRAAGKNPDEMIEIIRFGLKEGDAQSLESVLIDHYWGSEHLLNEKRERLPGDEGGAFLQIVEELRGKPATIREPGVLVWINEFWERGMSEPDLQKYSRGYWRPLSEDVRHRAKYLFAAAGGVIRGAWKIAPGTWTNQKTIPGRERHTKDRWSCTIERDEKIWKKYVGKVAPKGTGQGCRATPC